MLQLLQQNRAIKRGAIKIVDQRYMGSEDAPTSNNINACHTSYGFFRNIPQSSSNSTISMASPSPPVELTVGACLILSVCL